MQHSNIDKELKTILDWVRYTMTQLETHQVYYGHGTDNAWDEAVQLVLTCLQMPLDLPEARFAVLLNARVTRDEALMLNEWVQGRAVEQIPLPYISQTAWFAHLPFYVDERVLIPRSPFAELIEKRFSPYVNSKSEPSYILDMCTGSACIAIVLALKYSDAIVDAVDIDADALDVASINISNYHLEERVYPLASDLFDAVTGQKYDIIVANPPYVDAHDMATLPNEYSHEPEHALASGEDGLDLTVKILTQASQFLNDDGWLFVEVGNSEVNFDQRMQGLEVSWCELDDGGSGIFAISKAQLLSQQDILDELE